MCGNGPCLRGFCCKGRGGLKWIVLIFFGWLLQKEKDLYARIKKHRVDPSGGSSANPVPDYYGEKIGSVQGYRNWMKDQRAFNKKRQNFL